MKRCLYDFAVESAAGIMKKFAPSIILAIILACSSPLRASGDGGGGVHGRLSDSARLLATARDLAVHCRLEDAITEYKRLLFFFPECRERDEAVLEMAVCQREAGRPYTALALLSELAAGSDEKVPLRALFLMAETYRLGGDYSQAVAFYDDFIKRAPPSQLRSRAGFEKAWCYLLSGDIEQARQLFSKIRDDDPYSEAAEYAISACNALERLARKSPTKARVLSAVVPGLGHLYAGSVPHAAASFLINSLLIGASAVCFARKDNFAGALFLFFWSGWYTGGIESAGEDAKRFNDRTKDSIISREARRSGLRLRIGSCERGEMLERFLLPEKELNRIFKTQAEHTGGTR